MPRYRPSRLRRRQAKGGTPIIFLKARLKAASDLIAEFDSDGCNAGVASAQILRSNLHLPFGQIVHQWNSNDLGKAFGENRARYTGLLRQHVDHPIARRFAMDQ